MSKINNRIEEVFSHAVALEQNGRLRNTVYCIKDAILIQNSDNTVLLKFGLRKSEQAFKSPVSFQANDYDSRDFSEKNGKIIFKQQGEGWSRTKTVAAPGSTPEEMNEQYDKLAELTEDFGTKLVIDASVLPLLDESLSHIEIRAWNGNFVIVQRNIYSGAIIEITRDKGKGLLDFDEDEIEKDFGPVALRTNDFMALFSFVDRVTFWFNDEEDGLARIEAGGSKFPMSGVVGLCKYDEMRDISYATDDSDDDDAEDEPKPKKKKDKKDGRRKKQKKRSGESEADPEAGKKQKGRRRRRK